MVVYACSVDRLFFAKGLFLLNVGKWILCKIHYEISLLSLCSSRICKLFVAQDSSDLAEFKKALIDAREKEDVLEIIFSEMKDGDPAMRYFNVEEKDGPSFVIHDAVSDNKYRLTGVKPEDLAVFIQNFKVDC